MIPNHLRRHRNAAGLSLAALGARIGLRRQHVHRYETGEVRPRYERMQAIAAILGVGVGEIWP